MDLIIWIEGGRYKKEQGEEGNNIDKALKLRKSSMSSKE